MACLNCLQCLGYVDGKLQAIIDPDGFLKCNSQGEITHGTDLCPVTDDLNIDLSEYAGCENGIKITPDGELWMDPNPCMKWFTQEATGNMNALGVGPNEAVFTTAANLQLPAADPCYDTRYKIVTYAEIRFDQTGGTDYQILDRIDGVTNPLDYVEEWTMPRVTHFSRRSRQFVYSIVRPAGSAAYSVPFEMRIRTLGNTTVGGVLYDYRYKWDVLCMAYKTTGT